MKALKIIIGVLIAIGAGYFLAIDLFPGWFDDAIVAACSGTGATICSIVLGAMKKKAAAEKMHTNEMVEQNR